MRLSLLLPLLIASCAPARPAPARAKPTPSPEVIVLECDAPQALSSAKSSNGDESLVLAKTSFDKIPTWTSDKHGRALLAFNKSCQVLQRMPADEAVGAGKLGGTVKDWLAACQAAQAIPTTDHRQARQFFEQYFHAHSAKRSSGKKAKMTGYYLQELRVSRKRTKRYKFPIYGRPKDLVEVQLDHFIGDGRSRRIWGRRDKDGKLLPYYIRQEFRQGAHGTPIFWTDDPVHAIGLEIEGSGRGVLPNGKNVYIGFDGKNGHRSGRLGSVMRAMKTFRKRARGHYKKKDMAVFDTIADSKKSQVFFEEQKRAGAIGTQNVVLTPRRSVAVDRAAIPLSMPVFVSTRAPTKPGGPIGPWRQLTVAQDTGGNILGAIRVDIYFGDTAEDRAIGGRIHGPGRVWLLVPKTISERL